VQQDIGMFAMVYAAETDTQLVLRIEADKKTYVVGEPITIRAYLKNTTNKTIAIKCSWAPHPAVSSFAFGWLEFRTASGEIIKCFFPFSANTYVKKLLYPQQEIVFDTYDTQKYISKKPGAYTVVARYENSTKKPKTDQLGEEWIVLTEEANRALWTGSLISDSVDITVARAIHSPS